MSAKAVASIVMGVSVLMLSVAASVQSAPLVDRWKDQSPHKSDVFSSNGIQLNYLDWGGNGDVLIFLPGIGESAHIYDALAPKLTDSFHVYGLTRRGQGSSDKPKTGYALSTLIRDLRRFLDAKHIERATLIGHSFAGLEIAEFAVKYPNRVRSLIFLDATFDRSKLPELLASAPSGPTPTAMDRASIDAMREWSKRTYCPVWNTGWEAELHASSIFSEDGRYLGEVMPERVSKSLMKVAVSARPHYKEIKAPALAFFTFLDAYPERLLPLSAADDDLRRRAAKYQILLNSTKRADMTFFRANVKNGRVVEVDNADHFFFIEYEAFTVAQIRNFLRSSGRR